MFIFFSGCITLNIMLVIKHSINLSKSAHTKVGLYHCLVSASDCDSTDQVQMPTKCSKQFS